MSTESVRREAPSGTVRLRPAVAGDLAGVTALVASAGLITDGLEDQFPAGYVVAHSSDGELLGAAGLEVYGGEGFLRSVAVSAGRRGWGIGGQLVAECLARARAQNLRAVFLLTDTAADFFRRQGFVPLSREAAPPAIQAAPEFASLCPASSQFLRLSLRSS